MFNLTRALQITRGNYQASGGTIHQLKQENPQLVISDLLECYARDITAYSMAVNYVRSWYRFYTTAEGYNLPPEKAINGLICSFYYPVNSYGNPNAFNENSRTSYLLGYIKALSEVLA